MPRPGRRRCGTAGPAATAERNSSWQTGRVPQSRARRICLTLLASTLMTGAGCDAASTDRPNATATTSSSTTSDQAGTTTRNTSPNARPTGEKSYPEEVEHEGTYHGYPLTIVSTKEQPGSWTYR